MILILYNDNDNNNNNTNNNIACVPQAWHVGYYYHY